MMLHLIIAILFLATMMNDQEIEYEIAKDMAQFTHNPVGYVMYAYPWGEDALVGPGYDRPRDWQLDILDVIGSHLQNPATRYTPLCIAVASGHGIGKSALISWVEGWGMSTCDDCRIKVTANTENQLRTTTWPEITKWHKLAINDAWFDTHATSVVSTEEGHETSWRADAIPWNDKKPEAFAGTHNAKKRIIIIGDEASSIPDIIWETIEGALTDEETEIIWIMFGNPTQNSGRFKECFGKFRHRWTTRQIDSRNVEGTNKQKIQQWIDDYGEDSDFVRIRVKGIFPRQSYNQFIPTESINESIKFIAEPETYQQSARVFGVDCARFGDDNNSIAYRQGLKVHPFRKWYGMDTMQSTDIIVEEYLRHRPDAIFVDVGNMGAGIIDRLRQLIPAEKVIEINFGWQRPEYVRDPKKYYNKRAEIWGEMRDALKLGIDIPDDQDLKDDLEGVQYGFSNKSQIQLEKKEDMKSRGSKSPDDGDALALTFAQPVIKDHPVKQPRRKNKRRRGGPLG